VFPDEAMVSQHARITLSAKSHNLFWCSIYGNPRHMSKQAGGVGWHRYVR